MYMFQSEFEDAALKAYHEDPWTSSEDSDQDGDDKVEVKDKHQKEGGEMELSHASKYADDVQHEGGSSSKSNKK